MRKGALLRAVMTRCASFLMDVTNLYMIEREPPTYNIESGGEPKCAMLNCIKMLAPASATSMDYDLQGGPTLHLDVRRPRCSLLLPFLPSAGRCLPQLCVPPSSAVGNLCLEISTDRVQICRTVF